MNVDFLRFLNVLTQVLNLHDVVLGNEGVNLLTLLVNKTGVLKLSSQMKLKLNLELILKHAVNPLLKHVLAHRVVKLMLQTFIFKIEFDLVTAVITAITLQLDQVEVDFHGAFWDWLCLVRF